MIFVYGRCLIVYCQFRLIATCKATRPGVCFPHSSRSEFDNERNVRCRRWNWRELIVFRNLWHVTWVDMSVKRLSRLWGVPTWPRRLRSLVGTFPELLEHFSSSPMKLSGTTKFESSNGGFGDYFSNLQLQPSSPSLMQHFMPSYNL